MADIIQRAKKDNLVKEAKRARLAGFYPYFIPFKEIHGSTVTHKGKKIIMAGSNNYLGLAADPRVKEAAIKAIENYGTTCSGSPFLNGTLTLHEELGKKLARFVGKEAALTFTTGYLSNLGAISSLLKSGDHIFTDRYNHASIMDGIFLAQGLKGSLKIHRYKHNDPLSLEKALSSVPKNEPKIILTDGVFSMEGDITKLPEIKKLANKYSACVYLDEAHAIGVVGKTGKGTEEHYGVKKHADIVMGTFSKSFASIGGFVASDKDVIDYIKHHARPLIFTASMSPAHTAAVLKSLEIIEKEPQRTARLQQIADKMINGFASLGFNIDVAETAIVPLITGKQTTTLKFWRALFDNGVYTNVVLPPAVAPDRTMIRTSYMSIHTDEELDKILDVAATQGRKLKII
ncbi:MAG: pyridoxal phosphate-dependent aminotransferase family protein [Spirochaetales bacterium]|nr:pyridoxal phosphate-dependent aminotransferase family protein [Spirochaetales bacterium]